FYGGQLGAKGGVRLGRFTADAVMKVALGTVHESLNIAGVKSVAAGGLLIQAPVGIFTQPTNIGRYTQNAFAVVPEVQFFLGVDATSWLNLFVGYDFLYLSNALRPGQQIDRSINLTQFAGVGPAAGPARPEP